MDMRISGSGNIPAGKYQKVSVNGSGNLHGLIKCESVSSRGTLKGESVDCTGRIKTSGTAHFSGDVKASCARFSGTFSCDGKLTVSNTVVCSGTVRCQNSVPCNRLFIAGSARLGEGVEAERIDLCGSVKCEGLLNAEEVVIKADGSVDISAVGGSRITVTEKGLKRLWKRIPLFCRAVKNAQIQSIEGDEIFVSAVTCPRITGRSVTVGKNCQIDLVQYSDRIRIAKGAQVGHLEKIN